MKKIIIFLLTTTQFYLLSAQTVGIGTTNPSNGLLDLTGTNKGFADAKNDGGASARLSPPCNGLVVYRTNTEAVPTLFTRVLYL
ncbi:MAG: hypothetical protein IPK57_17600 [Chitinophagaceae bacterium]|nr:hypothetical protein [Chitinophagaceae bacterium]